jgi:putative chitinase
MPQGEGNPGGIDWRTVIRRIAPSAKAFIVDGLGDAMPSIAEKFQINTALRQAHFLAQLAHESANFQTTVEFASGAAYEGRADLGNTQRGDGVRFKGRGLIQLTGRSNYGRYGQILGVDFVGHPDLAAQFPWAALTGGEYWKARNINAPADRDDVVQVTRLINGGTNGLSSRQEYLRKAKDVLRNPPKIPGAPPAPVPPAPVPPAPATPAMPAPAPPTPDTPAPAPPTPANPGTVNVAAKCATTTVNIRSGAGTTNAIVEKANTGDSFVLKGDIINSGGYPWLDVSFELFLFVITNQVQSCSMQ